MRPWAPRFVVDLLVLALSGGASSACAPESIFDDEGPGAASETETETGTSFPPPPTPAFVDPASGRLEVRADQREPIELRVRAVFPGQTVLLIDGQSVGTLHPANAIGHLEDNRLTLNLDGALTTGVHGLTLFTPGDGVGPSSSPIAIDVKAGPARELEYALGLEVADGVEALAATTAGPPSVFWIENGADEPTLAVAPIGTGETPFDLSAPWRVPLPGYLIRPEQAPRIAVQRDENGLRVAWPVGASADRIDWAAWTFDDLAVPLASGTALLRTDPAFEPFEYVELGAPFVAADALVVEVVAMKDSEAARPGDRRLARLRWADMEAGPAELHLVADTRGEDLDAVGPLLDLRRVVDESAAEARADLVTRLSGSWARRLTIDGTTGLIGVDGGEARRHTSTLPFGELQLAAVAGALGSRTSLAVGGSEMVAVFEATFASRSTTDRLSLPLFPGERRMAPSPALLGGCPIFGVARGSERGIAVFTTDGVTVQLTELATTCDQLVFAPTAIGNSTDDTDTHRLPALCLQGARVFLGELRSPESP